MKRIAENALGIISSAGMSFTGLSIIYMLVSMFFGQQSIQYSYLWQFLLLSVLISTLQFLFFSNSVFKKTRYYVRIVCFGIPLYFLISGFAYFFKWFPIYLSSWLLFSAIFLFIFAVLIVVFELYARITGQRYNQLLKNYKTKQDS